MCQGHWVPVNSSPEGVQGTLPHNMTHTGILNILKGRNLRNDRCSRTLDFLPIALPEADHKTLMGGAPFLQPEERGTLTSEAGGTQRNLSRQAL